MKYSIRLTQPNGVHVYLSHRGKASFAPATAKKYLREYLAANPGVIARLENQFREPVETTRTRKESLFPVTTLDDKDYAAKVTETKKRLLSRPAWKLADCDFTPARP